LRPYASLAELTDTYCEKNAGADRKRLSRVLERLRKIINNHVGVIDLAEDLDIETVTEIFIRVNSAGTRTELDGSITIIADKYNGKKLNAPNDVAVASNGTIWFTDPGYGIKGDYEGLKEPYEQEKRNVFRVDPKSGEITVVVDDFVMPNGITFSPDEKKLYVIDTGLTEGKDKPAWIRVFDVDIDTGKVSNGKVFANDFAPGFTDGMRCDADGNVWCSMGWGDPKEDGVRCYSPEGKLLGKIHLPETVANLTFGGMRRNRLYICGSTSLYACYTSTAGAMKP
jgi:gluconolactonase